MPAAEPARRRIYGWWLLPVLSVAAALWLWPREDAPPPRAQGLLQEAAAALARGHLSAADGSGARELYAAAQAIDPDLPEARRGKVAVGRAALARARAALAQEDLPAAQRNLDLARQLQVPRSEWEAVDSALRAQSLAEVRVDDLLERAEAARAQGWLREAPPEFPGQSAALPLYQHILTLQPGNAEAMRGREEVLTELLDGARAALRTGELETAAAAIAAARSYDPGHIDLPDTLARLTEERAGVQREAAAALAQGRIEAAVEGWQRLVALDEEDPEARSGLARAAQILAERAVTLGEAHQFAEAERELARARALSPTSPGLHAAEVRIARARQGEVDSMPAADSLQALGICFDRALAANHLRRARECLNASRVQGEAVETLSTRRRQLAQRWVAIGDERLSGGDLPATRAALASARELDPAAPGVDALAQRLNMAQR